MQIQVEVHYSSEQTFFGLFSNPGIHKVLAVLQSFSGNAVAVTENSEAFVEVMDPGPGFHPISGTVNC